MSKSTYEANLEKRAELFKGLGHPVRLLILNLIRDKPRHGEELAAILQLNAATISHHLGILTEVGLLTSQKDQYYQTYFLDVGILDKRLLDVVISPQSATSLGVDSNAYRNKILQTFFHRGRLVTIPTQLKKRQIVLEKIAQEFEPGCKYSEKEVNMILVEFHDDIASLRRGILEFGLMERHGGVYQRKVVS
jgi:hypothetical protein